MRIIIFRFYIFIIFIIFTILMYFARLRLRAAFLFAAFLMRLTEPFYLFIYFNLCNEKNQRRKAARK